MSVVLMRMKKVPENCCECELRQDDFDRGEEFCPFTGVECLSIGRQANCPIIGVLPDTHGRLIDADEFTEHWLSLKDSNFSVETFIYSIDERDTIIPASEDLQDVTCIMISKEKRDIAFDLIEDILDTLIEVGNGTTDEMLNEACEQLFDVRDLLNGHAFKMRTSDLDFRTGQRSENEAD